jgi:hypothetical protein
MGFIHKEKDGIKKEIEGLEQLLPDITLTSNKNERRISVGLNPAMNALADGIVKDSKMKRENQMKITKKTKEIGDNVTKSLPSQIKEILKPSAQDNDPTFTKECSTIEQMNSGALPVQGGASAEAASTQISDFYPLKILGDTASNTTNIKAKIPFEGSPFEELKVMKVPLPPEVTMQAAAHKLLSLSALKRRDEDRENEGEKPSTKSIMNPWSSEVRPESAQVFFYFDFNK